MANKQTDKCPYPSIYGGKECYITPAQYIVELVCQKQSKFQKVQLPLRFWQDKGKWSNIYKRWLRQTHKLLKQYDSVAIIRALKNSGMKWSLHTDDMLMRIEVEQAKLNREKQNQPKSPQIPEKKLTQKENMGRLNRGGLPKNLKNLDL